MRLPSLRISVAGDKGDTSRLESKERAYVEGQAGRKLSETGCGKDDLLVRLTLYSFLAEGRRATRALYATNAEVFFAPTAMSRLLCTPSSS